MRAYTNVLVTDAEMILQHGWVNLDGNGVYLWAEPQDASEASDAEVTLCLDVPNEEMACYEARVSASGRPAAYVPAEVLNRLGRPRVYAHALFTGWSRRELLQLIRRREAFGQDGYPSAQDMRDAIRLFDLVGWRSAVRLQDGSV